MLLCLRDQTGVMRGCVDSLLRWLVNLGLEQYAQIFAENDMELEALFLLTRCRPDKLGVSLGHRRWLPKAIAEQNAHPAPRPAAQLNSTRVPSAESELISAQAERRQLSHLCFL